MPANFTVELEEDHVEEVLQKLDEVGKLAMEKCGVQAVTHAQDAITKEGAIDTGLLRNSITFGIGGEKTKISKYSASNNPGQHSGRSAPQDGTYSGKMPDDEKGQYTMYLGTNVYYAPYVEMGTKHGKTTIPARPYIKPALNDWQDEYKRIIEETLKG